MRIPAILLCLLLGVSLAQGAPSEMGAVETGQKAVHARRDDGWYARRGQGLPRKLSAKPDGTVTDIQTGLIWVADPSQCSAPFGTPGKPAAMSGEEAVKACKSLVYANSSDWRLPTVAEMQTLVNAGKVNPCVESSLFAIVPGAYWCATLTPGAEARQWAVDLATGFARPSPSREKAYFVLPVRSNPGSSAPSSRRFLDNGNGTVTDPQTGLMWVRDSEAAGLAKQYPWREAIARCERLEYAGHKDWRLPNRTELLSLVDYGRRDPSADPSFFVAQPAPYWSSTTFAGGEQWAWAIRFDRGDVDFTDKNAPLYVRPVRAASPVRAAR